MVGRRKLLALAIVIVMIGWTFSSMDSGSSDDTGLVGATGLEEPTLMNDRRSEGCNESVPLNTSYYSLTDYEYYYQDLGQVVQNISQEDPVWIHFYEQDMLVQLQDYSTDFPLTVHTDSGTDTYQIDSDWYRGETLSPAGGDVSISITDSWIHGYAEFEDRIYFNEVASIQETNSSTPYKAYRTEFGEDGPPSYPGPGPLTHFAQLIAVHADKNLYDYIGDKHGCDDDPDDNMECVGKYMLGETRLIRDMFFKYTWIGFVFSYMTVCDRDDNCGMTSSNAEDLIDQFLDYIWDYPPEIQKTFHIAHLFTGKDLHGDAIGRGIINGFRSLAQQVRAVGYEATPYQRLVLNIHEIGHVYNGLHEHAEAWWFGPGLLDWRFSAMFDPFMYDWQWPKFSSTNAHRIWDAMWDKPLRHAP